MSSLPTLSERLARMETLIELLEEAGEPGIRDASRELIQTLLSLHATGLARIIELATRSGHVGKDILSRWASDEYVRGMLLLHGLHPVDARTRIQQALEGLKAFLAPEGVTIELLEMASEGVRVQFRLTATEVGPTPEQVRQAIEAALCQAAPDLASIEIEEAVSGRCSLPLVWK